MRTISIIIKAFLHLCLFKSKPQDLPASSLLLGLMLIIYMLMSGILAPAPLSRGQSFLWSFVETGLLVILVSSLLYVIKHPRRITQTLTAMMGANAFLSLLSLPLMVWRDYSESHNLDLGMPSLLFLIVMFWNIAVQVYILRHALNVTTFSAFIITIILLSLMGTLLLSLFPMVRI
jgi:hypothetical protein